MKISQISKVVAATFVTTLLLLQPRSATAGGQGFDKNVVQDTKDYGTSGDLGLGKFSTNPFHVSVTVRGGYDDNVTLSSVDPQQSFFTNVAVNANYEFGSPRTHMSLIAGAGVTYYFDSSNNNDQFANDNFHNHDVNAYLGLNITHKASARLTLGASLYASYQSQPDFTTFNQTTFSVGRQSQNFFFTSNKFSAGYAWTPRFSTVSSYTLGYINYDDAVVSQFEDRFEHTFGNEFRFLVAPTTTLVAEYRFGIVDYTESDNRDSTSHFLLGGIDHSFSPRFNVSARAGVEFRSFDTTDVLNNGGDRTAPYFEGTVNYALGQSTSLTWTNRYSLEQPDVPEAFSRQTFRTALGVRHSFTPRITAGLNFAYQHDVNEGSLGISGFNEDAFDIALSVRYAINRNWSVDAGYTHTEVISDESLFRDYSRNRYYLGATFSF